MMKGKMKPASTVFSAALFLACFSSAAWAGHGSTGPAADAEPPTLAVALAHSGLWPPASKPDPAGRDAAGVARDSTTNSASIIDGPWRLTVAYRFTADGWKLISYGAIRRTASVANQHELGAQGAAAGAAAVVNFLPVGGAGNEPDPGNIPPPPAPDDPSADGQHRTRTDCPLPGSNWQVQSEWVWVPGGVGPDGNDVPGHWRRVKYLTYLPVFGNNAPFCNKGGS